MVVAAQPISAFDMLEVGVGPSSSHTLGPWRAAGSFVEELDRAGVLDRVDRVSVRLHGSLAKTGRGHGTAIALMMGWSGHDPVTCDVDEVQRLGPRTRVCGTLRLGGRVDVAFDRDRDIDFGERRDGLFDDRVPDGPVFTNPNPLVFAAELDDGRTLHRTSYSVGGGFVEHDATDWIADDLDPGDARPVVELPFAIHAARDLVDANRATGSSIADTVRANERVWRSDDEIDRDMLAIRDVMLACIVRGCHRRGVLPGGLDVSRRAPDLHDALLGDRSASTPSTDEQAPADWFDLVRAQPCDFDDTVAWVSCFALAVNEENAAFGRVVTAPTNGAAGVIPSVLFHHLMTLHGGEASRSELDAESVRFLLVAAEIGAIFKRGSTISAAMGGCQAEIGVSSAMAAAALTECRGGSVAQSLMAAEIAMEHHLGLTCDPVGGLVQVPCIERNAMGAMKAIAAARLARASEPERARVSLDEVIATMWETAQDMHAKYKETAEGGLAIRIPVSVVEC